MKAKCDRRGSSVVQVAAEVASRVNHDNGRWPVGEKKASGSGRQGERLRSTFLDFVRRCSGGINAVSADWRPTVSHNSAEQASGAKHDVPCTNHSSRVLPVSTVTDLLPPTGNAVLRQEELTADA